MKQALTFIQDKYKKLKTVDEKTKFLMQLIKQNFVQDPNDTNQYNQFDLKIQHYTGKPGKCTAGMLATIQYTKNEIESDVCSIVEIVDPNTNLGIFYSNFDKQDSRTTQRSVSNESVRIAQFGPGHINLNTWRKTYGFAV